MGSMVVGVMSGWEKVFLFPPYLNLKEGLGGVSLCGGCGGGVTMACSW